MLLVVYTYFWNTFFEQSSFTLKIFFFGIFLKFFLLLLSFVKLISSNMSIGIFIQRFFSLCFKNKILLFLGCNLHFYAEHSTFSVVFSIILVDSLEIIM